MKKAIGFGLAVVLLGIAAVALRPHSEPTTVQAELQVADLKSGLQPGDLVGAFNVEKCGGAVNDGREVGANFCYRCMLGAKPTVMVFSRVADAQLAALAKELDKSLTQNSDQKLSSFINLIGKDANALKATAKEFAANNKLENVALVVPDDAENGPEDFNINPEAAVTVTIYRNGKVTATRALTSGKLDDKEIAAIIDETAKILK